jgi:hypothetical protein
MFDDSTDGANEGINVTIFRPEAQMPQLDAGDVVLLHSVRVSGIGLIPACMC